MEEVACCQSAFRPDFCQSAAAVPGCILARKGGLRPEKLLERLALDGVDDRAVLHVTGRGLGDSHRNGGTDAVGVADYCAVWNRHGATLRLYPEFQFFRLC